LHIATPKPKLDDWNVMLENIRGRKYNVTIGLVGKYVQLHDAYLSVAEAIRHAGYVHSAKVAIEWIDSESITENNVAEVLKNCDGVIVPGGFGARGIEGKITSAKYCRENNLPYLGICLGMQIAVIEFSRSVCGLCDANSGEFNEFSKHKVIDFLPNQHNNIDKGGTLRLGAYPCKIKQGTKMHECYGQELISERHRHRYEFNNDYRELLVKNGLLISGTSPDDYIVETVEIKGNDFFVGVQFHPEFKSRPIALTRFSRDLLKPRSKTGTRKRKTTTKSLLMLSIYGH
jgi:CTP synthase